MIDILKVLAPYAGHKDLPEELKGDIKRELENRFEEAKIESDDYDKYQSALSCISALGLPKFSGKPHGAPPPYSDDVMSTVDDLINILR